MSTSGVGAPRERRELARDLGDECSKGRKCLNLAFDGECRATVNFYVWEAEQAARAFRTDAMFEQVAGLYRAKSTVELVEIAQRVDNA